MPLFGCRLTFGLAMTSMSMMSKRRVIIRVVILQIDILHSNVPIKNVIVIVDHAIATLRTYMAIHAFPNWFINYD